MPHPRLALWPFLVLGTLAPTAARADGSFVCEGTLQRIRLGDHITRVAALCGDPDQELERMEQRRWKQVIRPACKGQPEVSEEHVTDVLVDDWVYDYGYNHFTKYLRFENNILVRISSHWISSR
jgi:hypothetical protein